MPHTDCIDREDLADFLRRRREALQPEDVGLPAGRRRRTAGLRREEVAELANMSTDFYARIEQRRGSRPSRETIAALARALRLTLDERDHLFNLAGYEPPPRGIRSDHVSPPLLRILDHLDTPAQVTSDLAVTLAQNDLAVALLGDHSRFEGPSRSLYYRWFSDPEARPHARGRTRAAVAQLRREPARRPRPRRRGPGSARAGRAAARREPRVRGLWDQHEVGIRRDTRKRIIHPDRRPARARLPGPDGGKPDRAPRRLHRRAGQRGRRAAEAPLRGRQPELLGLSGT